MRHIIAATAIACLCALPPIAHAQVPEQVMAARQQGEAVLKKLAESRYRDLGLRSAEEGKVIEVGAPLREFMVRLDELSAYKAGDDSSKLLGAGDEYTFPVFIGKEVKSSFTVAKTGDTWAPVSFGSPNRTKTIFAVMTGVTSERRPQTAFFLVKVPAMYFHFLAYREDSTLYLIPILSDKSLEFTAGQPLLAEKVFELLAPLTAKYALPNVAPGDSKPGRQR